LALAVNIMAVPTIPATSSFLAIMAISFCARGRVWIDRFDSDVFDPELLKSEHGANPRFRRVDLI
jgi:hypothetical protein